MTERIPGFATLAIHAGAQPDPTTGARSTPIYQTTAYVFDDVDHAASLFNLHNFGYIYSRLTNPTVAVLEERIASLEGGRAAVAAAFRTATQAYGIGLRKTVDYSVVCTNLHRLPSSMTVGARVRTAVVRKYLSQQQEES